MPIHKVRRSEHTYEASKASELLTAVSLQVVGLPRGELAYDYADPESGVQRAVFDLAWPDGIQFGLSEPVAVLLNETPDVLSLASSAGLRFFTSVVGFQRYVESEILGLRAA